VKWNGIHIETHNDVYRPDEDTWLLAECVQDAVKSGDRFLEVGCGAGLVSLAAAKRGAMAFATDVNPFAVELSARNAKQNKLELQVAEGDLFGPWEGEFDVVAFNPPYLPTAPDDVVPGPLNHAFDGGIDGNQVVLRFAAAIANHPTKIVLVVHSSLSNPEPLDAAMASLGYSMSIAATRVLSWETLTVRRYA